MRPPDHSETHRTVEYAHSGSTPYISK